MNNVVLNDAVEDVAADEAKVTVNGGGSALDEGPLISLIVLGLRVSVVKVSNGNCKNISRGRKSQPQTKFNSPIQWFIQR